jgi:hypothetical protein
MSEQALCSICGQPTSGYGAFCAQCGKNRQAVEKRESHMSSNAKIAAIGGGLLAILSCVASWIQVAPQIHQWMASSSSASAATVNVTNNVSVQTASAQAAPAQAQIAPVQTVAAAVTIPYSAPPQVAPPVPVVATAPTSAVAATIRISPAIIHIGDPATISVIASGGIGQYSYSWSGDEGLIGDGSIEPMHYKTAGLKEITVTVRSGGLMTTTRRSLIVLGASTPAQLTLNVHSPLWAESTVIASTSWEPSLSAAKAAAFRTLWRDVMALPLEHGGTIGELVRRTPGLWTRLSRQISLDAVAVPTRTSPTGEIAIEERLPLNNIARLAGE